MTSLAYIWAAFKHFNEKRTANKNLSFFKVYFLPIISMIFWPITYLCREVMDRVKLENKGTNELVEESKKYWVIIKTLENGCENVIQMFLQLYLLKPYISFQTTLSLREFLQFSVSNIFHYSDSLCEESNISIGMSKLLLSILSLSYGASSRQTSKPGITLGQTIKNTMLWLSFASLSISRITAIFSLVALQSPIHGIVCFLLIHLALVFLILREKNVSCTCSDVSTHFKTIISTHFTTIMSCISSHTVIISFEKKERGKETFRRQLYFQSLILLENTVLCFLPLIIPDHYPTGECYDYSHKFIAFVIGMWSIGIILQVIYLKFHKVFLYSKSIIQL